MRQKIAIATLTSALLLAGCGSDSDTSLGIEPEHEQQSVETFEATNASLESAAESLPEAVSSGTKEDDGENSLENVDKQEDEMETIIMNGIEIMKECPADAYETRANITYGTVTHQTYHSKTTGLDRGVNILLPADYDETKKYPVLYLLHGIFGDEYALCNDPNIHLAEIAGNLAADGLAKEMIIVLPNMFAASDPDLKPSFSNEGVAPYDNFINDLVNDLIPYIEETYSVLQGRENRAIAGFSMGGRETLFIGLSRPDLFAYVGAIAPAPGLTPNKDWAMTHPGQLQEEELTFAGKDYEPDVLMVCCGTQDGTVDKFPESYHNIFENNEVSHVWYEVPGADHDDKAIRSGVYNFARAIFKDK